MHYDIPDDLHRKVKAAAAMNGQTLKDFIIEALERSLDTKPRRTQ
jgi:predicted HicB family RNase H-like nuclease